MCPVCGEASSVISVLGQTPLHPWEHVLLWVGRLTTEAPMMPIMGNMTVGRKAVIARGRASVHQRNAMRMMV